MQAMISKYFFQLLQANKVKKNLRSKIKFQKQQSAERGKKRIAYKIHWQYKSKDPLVIPSSIQKHIPNLEVSALSSLETCKPIPRMSLTSGS